MFDDEELGRAVNLLFKKLGQGVKETLGDDNFSFPLYLDPGSISNLLNRVDLIANNLAAIAEQQEKTGALVFESSVLLALQKENAALQVELGKSQRRERALMQIINDLASACMGCRKDKWRPHAPDCIWGTSVEDALKKLTEKVSNGDQTQEAEEHGTG